MEKFGFDKAAEASETKNEPEINTSETKEDIGLSAKILNKLMLWGLIGLSGTQAIDTGAQSAKEHGGQDTKAQAVSFERGLDATGLMSSTREHAKPTIAVTTRENIENGLSGRQTGGIRNLLTEEMTVDLVASGAMTLVSRDPQGLRAIIDEAKLGRTGLIDQEQIVRFGNWTTADYYVIPSIKKDNDKEVYASDIVDVRNGDTFSVSAAPSEEYSEASIKALASETEKAIQDHESKLKNGKE